VSAVVEVCVSALTLATESMPLRKPGLGLSAYCDASVSGDTRSPTSGCVSRMLACIAFCCATVFSYSSVMDALGSAFAAMLT
jgi:hypothetical protein